MIYEENYYCAKLKDALARKQRKNEKYSLRAFSKYLDMSPSTLSLVMQGKRPVPKKNLDNVLAKLNLAPSEESLFRESLKFKDSTLLSIKDSPRFKNRFILDDTHFSIISEWEHYALLSLIETLYFKNCEKYISQRLGISIQRSQIIKNNLIEADLIQINDDNNLELTHKAMRTTEDITSKALRAAHLEVLELGKRKLEEVDVLDRDYSTITMAIDPKNLPKAKKYIRDFRKKLASLLEDGVKEEVYQLAIQLYPLTKINKEKK